MLKRSIALLMLTVLVLLSCPRLAWSAAPPTPATASWLRQGDSLLGKAGFLRMGGNLTDAIGSARKAVTTERLAVGEIGKGAPWMLADLLEQTASAQEQLGKWLGAEKIRQEAVALLTKSLGAKHWRVTNARLALARNKLLAAMSQEKRDRLAKCLLLDRWYEDNYRQGDPRKALEQALAGLQLRIELLGDQHPEVAASLNNLGMCLKTTGEYERANKELTKALELRRKQLGEDHPLTAVSANNLATLLHATGDFPRANHLLRQALTVFRGWPGEQSPPYAVVLNNTGMLAMAQGDLAVAERCIKQAFLIRKQRPERPRLREAQLPGLYEIMGNAVDSLAMPVAEEGGRRLLSEAEQWSPAAPASNLGLLALALGKYTLADDHFREALRLVAPNAELAFATILHNRALLRVVQKRYDNAQTDLDEVLRLRRKKLGVDHPLYLTSRNNLGLLHYVRGDYTQAEKLLAEAATGRRKRLGALHIQYAASLANLALLADARGDSRGAARQLNDALDIARRNVELCAVSQSERQQLAMRQHLRGFLDHRISLAVRGRNGGNEVYGHVLAWKGAVFSRQRWLRELEAGRRSGKETAKLWVELDTVGRRMATLALSAIPPAQQPAWQREVARLGQQKRRLEEQLTKKHTGFATMRQTEHTTPAQLQKLLPAGTALVDLLEYTHYQPPAQRKGWGKRERLLAAFVLRRGQEAVLVDLGRQESAADAIRRWRKTAERRVAPIEGDDDPAIELRKQLWEPLRKYLEGADTVLVSPDGVVNRLPLAALPGSKDGRYLLEEIALAVIPVPQVLPEILADKKGARLEKPSLLTVGNVAFGPASASLDRPPWVPLPETKAETDLVQKRFSSRYPDGPIKPLGGADATEERVRQQAPRYRWLHIATHGDATETTPPGQSVLAPELFAWEGGQGTPPGLLAYLVLAGANRAAEPGRNDGLLTALEAAELDLSGVELAVLSACKTGLGKAIGGEGLLSMQRAFQVAGARAVVASLWEVDDVTTRHLLVRFYEKLWTKGKQPAKLQALRQAQLWMLNNGELGLVRPTQGDKSKGEKAGRTPPFYWAPFVLSGDWQ